LVGRWTAIAVIFPKSPEVRRACLAEPCSRSRLQKGPGLRVV